MYALLGRDHAEFAYLFLWLLNYFGFLICLWEYHYPWKKEKGYSSVATSKNSMELKTKLPYHPEILLLGIYPKKTKTVIWKDICTPMFITALFIIAKIQKQS